MDLRVNKNFRITRGVRLQFRNEFLNVLNPTNSGVPNQQSNSTACGTIITTYPPRQNQFGLKLLFRVMTALRVCSRLFRTASPGRSWITGPSSVTRPKGMSRVSVIDSQVI